MMIYSKSNTDKFIRSFKIKLLSDSNLTMFEKEILDIVNRVKHNYKIIDYSAMDRDNNTYILLEKGNDTLAYEIPYRHIDLDFSKIFKTLL